jgi:hypothetical protein
LNGTAIGFGTGSAIAITSGEVVGASSDWQISGSPQLYFEYLSNSIQEELTNLPLIHLESISLPHAAVYKLRISRVDGSNPGFVREVEFDTTRARRCAFSVPEVGSYTISFESTSPVSGGSLEHE